MWAHSGRELFYRNGDGDLVVADVVASPTFRVAQHQILFSALGYAANEFDSQYDVSLDDQRFLMILLGEEDAVGEMAVVMNWFEELKERVPN